MASKTRAIKRVAKKTDRTLGSMIDYSQNSIQKAIAKLEKRIMDMAADLNTARGRLVSTGTNLKLAQSMHGQLTGLFDEIYGDSVRTSLAGFDDIYGLVRSSFSELGIVTKFTGVDKDVLKTLKNASYAQFEAYGDEAISRLSQGLYNHVLAGSPMSELTTIIQGIFTGHVDARGRPMSVYANQYAFDSVMNTHNQINLQKAKEAKLDHFLYSGDVISSSRPFCIQHAGYVFSREEIESWDEEDWVGKAGPAMIYRGGYNCRHHWVPVDPEWVPEGEIEVQRVGEPSEEQPTEEPTSPQVALSKGQEQALDFAATGVESHALDDIDASRLAERYGYTKEQVLSLSKQFDELPVAIDRKLWPDSKSFQNLLKTGEMENQFTIAAKGGQATSSGALAPFKGQVRDRWESNFTNEIFQKDPRYLKVKDGAALPLELAKERPIYGYARDARAQFTGHTPYGDVSLVMKKDVAKRATFTLNNSSQFSKSNINYSICTTKNPSILIEHFLENASDDIASYGKAFKNKIIDRMEGRAPLSGFTPTNSRYVESQIYGGINIGRDVEKIIVHGTKLEYGHILKLGRRWNIPVEFV
jgi:hypothetical protein